MKTIYYLGVCCFLILAGATTAQERSYEDITVRVVSLKREQVQRDYGQNYSYNVTLRDDKIGVIYKVSCECTFIPKQGTTSGFPCSGLTVLHSGRSYKVRLNAETIVFIGDSLGWNIDSEETSQCKS